MKINWRVRFKNPMFLFQLFLAIAVPIGAYFGITGQDITSWVTLFNIVGEAASNPFVVGTVIVSVYNALTDPTVAGLSDSNQALRYERPKKEGK